MAMSEFTKKALRDMNTRFAWVVLFITLIFIGLDYAVQWFSRNLTVTINPPDFFNGYSYSAIIEFILFGLWAFLMLILMMKWLFRQYIARRK